METKFLLKSIENTDKKVVDILLENGRSTTLNNLCECFDNKTDFLEKVEKEGDLNFEQELQTINDYIILLSSSLISVERLLKVYYMSNILLGDDKTSKIIIQHLKHFINIEGTNSIIQEIKKSYSNLPVFVTILMESLEKLAHDIINHNIVLEEKDKIKFNESKTIKWYRTGFESYEPLWNFKDKIQKDYGHLKIIKYETIKHKVFKYIRNDNLEIFKYILELYMRDYSNKEETKIQTFSKSFPVKIFVDNQCENILDYLVNNHYICLEEFNKIENIRSIVWNYNYEIYKIFMKFNKNVDNDISYILNTNYKHYECSNIPEVKHESVKFAIKMIKDGIKLGLIEEILDDILGNNELQDNNSFIRSSRNGYLDISRWLHSTFNITQSGGKF